MSLLRKIQKDMQDYILSEDKKIRSAIVDPPELGAASRLNVYRNGYYLRLIHILEDDYVMLRKYLGENDFDAVIRDYLDAYPSHHFTIRKVGEKLPQFLEEKAFEPDIVELASFEWLMTEVLFAADAEVLTLTTLSKLPAEQWGNLRFTLHPSVRQLFCHYNTLTLWEDLEKDKTAVSQLLDTPASALIWRYQNEVYFQTLEHEQSVLMTAIVNGNEFSDLCEKMLEFYSEDEAISMVASTLQAWIQDGMLQVPSNLFNFQI